MAFCGKLVQALIFICSGLSGVGPELHLGRMIPQKYQVFTVWLSNVSGNDKAAPPAKDVRQFDQVEGQIAVFRASKQHRASGAKVCDSLFNGGYSLN